MLCDNCENYFLRELEGMTVERVNCINYYCEIEHMPGIYGGEFTACNRKEWNRVIHKIKDIKNNHSEK